MKQNLLIVALGLGLAGCVAQPQLAQIPYSPTGCYVLHERGLITSAIFGRYEPAPCNIVAVDRPAGVISGSGPGWSMSGTVP